MKKVLLFLVVVLVVAGISGCATIIQGTSQDISFNSNVKGAEVTVNGVVVGKTPVVAHLKKKSKHAVIVISKEGYKTKKLLLRSKTTGWFWGNILLGGCVGSSTDSSTGAKNEYAPSQLFITLEPSASEGDVSIKKTDEMRRFVLMNYDRINKDIAKGSGEYLKSLCEFYGAKTDAEAKQVLSNLKDAQAKSTTMIEFAQLLVERI